MTRDYDRLYDTGSTTHPAALPLPSVTNAPITWRDNTIVILMREGGLEPPSLAAPDPKSRSTPPGALSSGGINATGCYGVIPTAPQSTTESTTSFSYPVETSHLTDVRGSRANLPQGRRV